MRAVILRVDVVVYIHHSSPLGGLPPGGSIKRDPPYIRFDCNLFKVLNPSIASKLAPTEGADVP